MRFEFGGRQFRIRFEHDRSRLLGDHLGHPITVRNGELGVRLRCLSCQMFIGEVPKSLRKRRTRCLIEVAELGRWVEVLGGIGTPNEDAGDRFTKRVGRREALRNALSGGKWLDDLGEDGRAVFIQEVLKAIKARWFENGK